MEALFEYIEVIFMEITNCVTHETTNAAVMGLGSNEQEMLNFAIKNGIIDLPHLQDQVEMMKNAEILQNHQYNGPDLRSSDVHPEPDP